jgi:2-polyprenyl-6-hydroxyphenyl methylase/3-demethylubiquinone-9 3-methyltransferase
METGINNQFYDELGEEWNHRFDHPIALLRAENKIRTPWVAKEIDQRLGRGKSVLDVGCGGGLLSNALAQEGHRVTGIDLSEPSLVVAQKNDPSGKVQYLKANAYSLPFEDRSFDAVCAMDVLEHVEEPRRLIAEAGRVLKPGGLFFFHTFNRNLLSYLLVIKGVEWFVRNAPTNMHVYPLFIRPQELSALCKEQNLQTIHWTGLQPSFSWPMMKMAFTRTVPKDFSFRFCKSLATGYCGIARKDL